MIFPQ